MAVDLHNKELLLPPQFFSEESDSDTLSVNKQQPINQNWSCFGSSDSGSELNSPVESELGSTETESSEEEDDYIAELTRQMAHYMFQDDDNKQEKVCGLGGSPQSTLWSALDSNHDSPIGPSREPSPPVTPMIGNFEKMKINDDMPPKFNNHGDRFCTTPIKPTSVRKQNLGFHSNQVLVGDQIRAMQFYRLKQEQILKQQESQYWKRQADVSQKLESKQQLKNFNDTERSCNGFSNGQQKDQWPALQQQQQLTNHQRAGSEMRAVFLKGSGSRTGSGGTGVFLPRGIGNSIESRKRSGCSTVLIPARVVQALKLHFDKMGDTSRSNGSSYPLLQHDTLMGGRSSLHAQLEPQSRTAPAMNHQEMGLPQEWTY